MSEETILASMAEADRILREAGWTPARAVVAVGGEEILNTDRRFAFANVVCGHPPEGSRMTFVAKPLDKIPQALAERLGLDPADYPDEHHEAALWLVAHAKWPTPPAAVLAIDPEVAGLLSTHLEPEHHPDLGVTLALQSEEVETPGDESNGETGEASADRALDEGDDSGPLAESVEVPIGEPTSGELDLGTGGDVSERVFDAEYFELPDDPPAEVEDLGAELLDEGQAEFPALEGADPEDFAPDEIEHPETSGGAFIFGDNLDQLRTAAIGRVIRYANGIMPRWLPEDDARLSELRNFVMGVSERRWDDNPANQAELNALETTIRRINEIKNARDTKVEFLEGASREEIEDFAVEANWP